MRVIGINDSLRFKNTLVKRQGQDDFDRMFDRFDKQFEKGRARRQKNIERSQKMEDTFESIEAGAAQFANAAPVYGLAALLLGGSLFPSKTNMHGIHTDSLVSAADINRAYTPEVTIIPQFDNTPDIIIEQAVQGAAEADDLAEVLDVKNSALPEESEYIQDFDVALETVFDSTGGTISDMQAGEEAESQYIEIEPETEALVSEPSALEDVAEAGAAEEILEPGILEPENDAQFSATDFDINLSESQEYAMSVFLQNWEDNRERYEAVYEATGVPAILSAAIHFRESSGNFNRRMSDGGPLGSYSSWEESAIDALSNCNMPPYKLVYGDFETYYEYAERYNGLGYRKHNMKSPYIWAGTSNYTCGKYVRDGKFDPNAVDRQLGVAVMLDALKEYDCA